MKVMTQPSVAPGSKRKPCATAAGTRMAAGAANGSFAASCHLAAAALDQENSKQIAMPMRADGPVVNRGARCNRFNMNEVERLIVRRIAVKMKQGSGLAMRQA